MSIIVMVDEARWAKEDTGPVLQVQRVDMVLRQRHPHRRLSDPMGGPLDRGTLYGIKSSCLRLPQLKKECLGRLVGM